MATQPVRPENVGKSAAGSPAQASQLGLHHRIDLDETLAALLADGVGGYVLRLLTPAGASPSPICAACAPTHARRAASSNCIR